MPLTSKTALLLLYGQGPPQQDMILVELSNIPRKQCGLEQDSWIPGNLIMDCVAGIRRKSDLLLHTIQERILAVWMGGEPRPGLVVVCPYGPYENDQRSR